jgi:hypothetical protein
MVNTSGLQSRTRKPLLAAFTTLQRRFQPASRRIACLAHVWNASCLVATQTFQRKPSTVGCRNFLYSLRCSSPPISLLYRSTTSASIKHGALVDLDVLPAGCALAVRTLSTLSVRTSDKSRAGTIKRTCLRLLVFTSVARLRSDVRVPWSHADL